jgi:hypothetical protein
MAEKFVILIANFSALCTWEAAEPQKIETGN